MDIDRRALLIGGCAVAGGIVVGNAGNRLGWWDIDFLGRSDPDDALTRVLRGGEAELVRAHELALAQSAPGALTDRLQTNRQHHIDHLAALGGGQSDIDRALAPGETDPDDPDAPPPVPPLPADAGQWPAFFATLERGQGSLATTGVKIALGGGLARLLALVLASEEGHAQEWSDG